MIILLIYKESLADSAEQNFIKRKKKKGLAIGDRRPIRVKMKGLKGESLTLNPDLLHMQAAIESDNVGTFAHR